MFIKLAIKIRFDVKSLIYKQINQLKNIKTMDRQESELSHEHHHDHEDGVQCSKRFAQELLNQKYDEIITGKEKWTDTLFPPTDDSLYSGKTEFSESRGSQVPDWIGGDSGVNYRTYAKNHVSKNKGRYEWKRLSDNDRGYNIIRIPKEIKKDDDILTEDINQGELGNCYFLSALSSLAEVPQRIQNMFPNDKVHKNGVFECLVYIHGFPMKICVDDYFPFMTDSKEIAFTKVSNNSTRNIWPMILEKAWAKVNKNYENTIAGNSGEAFEFLTPAPIDIMYHEAHKDIIFKKLKDADRNNWIMCTDITDIEDTDAGHLAEMGLVSNHAYSIIDTKEYDDRGIKYQLLKLHNPYGTVEWTGDWSDSSDRWTPEMQELFQYKPEDDGTFWIDYRDFLDFYTTTYICKVNHTFKYIHKKIHHDFNQMFNLIEVNIPEDAPKNNKENRAHSSYFLLNQKTERIYRNIKNDEDFVNRFASMIVFKKEGNKYTYIGSSSGERARLYVECKDITKGKYYIAVSYPKKHESDHSHDHDSYLNKAQPDIAHYTFNVGFYSDINNVEINSLTKKNNDEIVSSFLIESLFHCAEQKEEDKYYFEYEGENATWRSVNFENEAGAYGYICWDNKSDGYIHETFSFTQFQNINLVPIMKKSDFKLVELDVETENTNKKHFLEIMKDRKDFQSSVEIKKALKCELEVNEENPFEIIAHIAPKSRALILIEKTDEDSSIEMSSQVVFTYPAHVVIADRSYTPKITFFNYEGKQVAIKEKIFEHSGGVVFKYKNGSHNLRATIHVRYPKMNNLIIAHRPEDFTKEKPDQTVLGKIPSYQRSISNIENNEKEVVLHLEPGQEAYFDLEAKDVFKTFSYSSKLDYVISKVMNY
jgi:hypothetical protein